MIKWPFVCLSIFSVFFQLNSKSSITYPTNNNEPGIFFTENKGQVKDQYGKPRKDVLFSGQSEALVFHLFNNGISYQLSRSSQKNKSTNHFENHFKRADKTEESLYRVDVQWLNSNPNCHLKTSKVLSGSNNYTSEFGLIENVKSYGELLYEELYKGIDLRFYQWNGKLKYDFIVSEGADYHNIALLIKGASRISIGDNGTLRIHTPLGVIEEEAPLVFQGKRQLKSHWEVKANTIRFNIEDHDPSLPMIIDPGVRAWGTYCGAGGNDIITSTACDALGNVYVCGYTSSNTGTAIASFGSHMVTYAGGSKDAFVAKFTSAGLRVWGTYYGAGDEDLAFGLAVDASGNVFVAGATYSASLSGTAISTPGAHQVNFGGDWDAFLVKFNTNGIRQWGTFYGGPNSEEAISVSIDNSGDVIIIGTATSSSLNVVATAGSWQNSNNGQSDTYIAKFNTNGVRQWGTFFGALSGDYAYGGCIDATGNIYIAGTSNSGFNSLSSPGSWQANYSGNFDAFMAKFSAGGVRLWSTYYGGFNSDFGKGCKADKYGNVFLVGYTNNSTNHTIFASGGIAHQNTYGGGVSDGFAAKFNSAGSRIWGTYFGNNGTEEFNQCAVDTMGNLIVAGYASTNGLAGGVLTVHQNTIGGATDAILAKFNGINGYRNGSTYYGGGGLENGLSCALNANGAVYLAGSCDASSTGTSIATTGTWQWVPGGNTDGMLVKFDMCGSAPPNILTSLNTTVCPGTTLNLIARGLDSYTWFPGGMHTETVTISPSVTTVYTVQGSVSGCTTVSTNTRVVHVYPNPTIQVNSGVICQGESFTLTPSGAQSYTYNGFWVYATGPNLVLTPTSNATYSITGTSSNNCVSTQSAISSVTVAPVPTITAVGPNTPLCGGSVLSMSVSGASSYTWFPGSLAGAQVTVSPAGNTNYTVYGFNGGCSDTAFVSITVLSLPNIQVSGGSICNGQSFTITPSGASSYSYPIGGPVVSPVMNTSYIIQGTGNNGCTASVQVQVNVNSIPTIAVTSGSICLGQVFQIVPSGAASYTIQGGSFNVSPLVNTIYTVSGTSSAGCSASLVANATVIVYPNPTLNIITSNSLICAGEQVQLQASGAVNYTWSTGSSNVSSINVTPTANTGYTVTGQNSLGCKSSASFTQEVDACLNLVELMKPDSIMVYPNPAKDNLTLSIGLNQWQGSGLLINALGQEVVSIELVQGLNTMDLRNCAAGIYILQIVSEGKMLKQLKVVLED